MIIGIGIDVCDVERFAESVRRRPRMVARLFTPAEAERPVASQAARFAAKEAVAKAESGQASALKQQLDQFKKSAAAFQKQLAEAEKQAQQSQGQGAQGAPASNPFENPLGSSGGLGGSSLSGP